MKILLLLMVNVVPPIIYAIAGLSVLAPVIYAGLVAGYMSHKKVGPFLAGWGYETLIMLPVFFLTRWLTG